MRTFLSQLDTARCSDAGLNDKCDMLSSGGLLTSTSLLKSPCVGLAALAADAFELKKLAIFPAKAMPARSLSACSTRPSYFCEAMLEDLWGGDCLRCDAYLNVEARVEMSVLVD